MYDRPIIRDRPRDLPVNHTGSKHTTDTRNSGQVQESTSTGIHEATVCASVQSVHVYTMYTRMICTLLQFYTLP